MKESPEMMDILARIIGAELDAMRVEHLDPRLRRLPSR